ncbi:MbcA/ParS/Xre antitoxin family protein [Photobacterium makurazakiensis]|uniref:antitoxin Xre/MbcA/ParS toxin-binding domain-containing protein n=1 Tax=Photobacterium makurazakiensis TaxID=2910234 RepID=UPI003D0F714D
MEKKQIPAELYGQALDYFGSQEATESWFTTENIELGLVTPASLCRSAKGTEQVNELLKKLESGV